MNPRFSPVAEFGSFWPAPTVHACHLLVTYEDVSARITGRCGQRFLQNQKIWLRTVFWPCRSRDASGGKVPQPQFRGWHLCRVDSAGLEPSGHDRFFSLLAGQLHQFHGGSRPGFQQSGYQYAQSGGEGSRAVGALSQPQPRRRD